MPGGVEVSHGLGLLGGWERLELGEGAAKPDLAVRSVHKVNGNKPPPAMPGLGVDREMRDLPGDRVDDYAAYLTAGSIGAAGVGADPERHHLRHPLVFLEPQQAQPAAAPPRRATAGAGTPAMSKHGWCKSPSRHCDSHFPPAGPQAQGWTWKYKNGHRQCLAGVWASPLAISQDRPSPLPSYTTAEDMRGVEWRGPHLTERRTGRGGSCKSLRRAAWPAVRGNDMLHHGSYDQALAAAEIAAGFRRGGAGPAGSG